ncbi:o-succinylbenzoate synthase [Litchfieldia salsa]|uniref:o-succinylbenzoate synthase n=1 Tax=Litchfieldia salsa TaxID=930152 RepID=A0A1H0QHC8_9BACI|nr:o-succinylbenzoate synthase [Litchfieldia salsa]SDP16139.1 O-succinylbenzoate synthase [Litchfieldia salsa]
MMQITKITLYLVEQTLKTPFISSLERVEERESILIKIKDAEGFEGWGEVVAFSSPWYTEETVKTCWHIIEDFLAPILYRNTIEHPSDTIDLFKGIKRNQMAKSGVETALWDLYSKRNGMSLARAIGGTRTRIASGVVVGISEVNEMINTIDKYVNEGYKRIKIKIKPGNDYHIVKSIRDRFPDLPLMVDANSSYSLEQIDSLKALDSFGLMMIEQPLESDDIVDHAKVQKHLHTPICLDESIVTYEDARKAIELGSCKIINIKVGRVGGLTEAIRIQNLCKENNIPVWCGGMLEMGVSRAVNIALASLDHFSIPGDVSASARYWEEDITVPEVKVVDGYIDVPEKPGIGFDLNMKRLKAVTKYKKEILSN